MSAYQMANYSTFEPHKVVKRILLPKLMLKSLPHLCTFQPTVPCQFQLGYELSQHFGIRHRIMMLVYKLISWKDRCIDSSQFERSSSVGLNLIKNEQTLLVCWKCCLKSSLSQKCSGVLHIEEVLAPDENIALQNSLCLEQFSKCFRINIGRPMQHSFTMTS